MKKVLSILFAVLIIASSIHLTIAVHYCGGSFEEYKISVSGEKAGCAMEPASRPCDNKGLNSRHCCTDKVGSYLITENYTPATFEPVKSSQSNFIVLPDLSVFLANHSFITNVRIVHSPPGEFMPCKPELATICIFRI